MPLIPQPTSEILAKYTISGNTYKRVVDGDARKRHELEVGDSKTPNDFIPQVKWMRWDNEANLSLRLQHGGGNLDVTTSGETITFSAGMVSASFYPVADNSGFEFDITLKSKPPTNTITFSLQHKGLEFFFQPTLANVDPDGSSWQPSPSGKGILRRPAKVNNSWAIYYKNCPANICDGKIYATGKFGHIFRPQLVDAIGNKAWGEIAIDAQAGTLTATIPQSFLNSAVYPITKAAGLEFGYSTAGGSTNVVSGEMDVSKATSTPSSNGSLDRIKVYCSGATATVSHAIYSDSGGSPNTRLAYNDTGTNPGSSAAWLELSLTYNSITSGTQYWLGWCNATANSLTLYYDDGAGESGDDRWTDSGNWPATISGWNSNNFRYSIYAEYTQVTPTVALTGTVTSDINESDIVAGGKTIILTVTNDTFVPANGTPTYYAATTKGTTAADSAGGGGARTGDGDLTCTFPSGYTPTAGHFALMIVYSDQGSGSTPANWSAVTGSPFGAGTEKLDIFYKVLTGGESAPVTTISGSTTNMSHCANMVIYSGVGSIGAIGTASNGTGTPMTAGGITTTVDGSIVCGCCGRGDNENASAQTFNASATGVVERLDGGTGAGNDSQVSMADKTIASASTSTGNFSATTSVTDPWVAVVIELVRNTPFTSARQAIINGLDSAQSEAAGWDAVVKAGQGVAGVVRTSDTVCTITLDAFASYNITATETITATLPASAFYGNTSAVASPTFTVASSGGTNQSVNLTGISATGNKTAPTSTGTANVSPSGIQATGGKTAPTAQAVTLANATGIAATGEQTAPATQGTANVTLVGQPATGAIGSVTASTPSSATVDLTGLAASGERGTPEATATARHTLAGIAASGDKGMLAAAGTGSAALPGIGSAADIGDPSAALQTRAALDGIPATGEAADVGNEILTNAALSGRQGAAAVGACTVTITSANQTFVDVIGLAATGGIGDLGTSGTATVAAWGIESVGTFGEIYWPPTQTQTGGRRRRKGGGSYIAPPKPEKPKVYAGGTVEAVNAFTLGLAWAESTSEGVLVAPPALVAGRGFTETGFDGSVFAGKPQVTAAAIVIPQQNDDAELILMGIL